MIRLTDDVKKRIEQSGVKIVDLTAEHLKTIRKFIPTEKPQK